jgi:hypothetical protein
MHVTAALAMITLAITGAATRRVTAAPAVM